MILEAKESSEIENIVTTYDRIFKEIILHNDDKEAKAVVNYRFAIHRGLHLVKEQGFISTNTFVEIHRIVEPEVGDIRKILGTIIMNTKTKEVVHTPPQNEEEIRYYLSSLENYINDDSLENIDPLIKMPLIHFMFESIHPFHDGNGRTGRILNVLYLVLKDKLSEPILYLSKFINTNKASYYEYLNRMQKDINDYKDYVLFMLNAIESTSEYTINFIDRLKEKMNDVKNIIKLKLPKIYSDSLVEYLFNDFYTKNEYFRTKLNLSRNTASKYLHLLVEQGILIEKKVGKETIYKNAYLYELVKHL